MYCRLTCSRKLGSQTTDVNACIQCCLWSLSLSQSLCCWRVVLWPDTPDKSVTDKIQTHLLQCLMNEIPFIVLVPLFTPHQTHVYRLSPLPPACSHVTPTEHVVTGSPATRQPAECGLLMDGFPPTKWLGTPLQCFYSFPFWRLSVLWKFSNVKTLSKKCPW